MKSELAKKSKFLSYVLRHKPESIGITLDDNGWVEVTALLEACTRSGNKISAAALTEVVETNDKKRFAFSEDGERIRASQGHSIKAIDLQLEAVTPPDLLYHGTVEKFIETIRETGLQKMNRQHVHLSSTVETAINVGSRRGKPTILRIDSGLMHTDGFRFFRSANGVWLTDAVPWEYIESNGE